MMKSPQRGSRAIARRTFSKRIMAVAGLSILPVCLLAGRKAQKEEGSAAQLSKAPSAAWSLKNPYEGQPEAVAAGQKLYAEHCAECHGPDGRGLERAANLHSTIIQDAPSGVLFWALRNGRIRKGMPSWSRLPDEQLWQMVSFIKTLK